MHIKNVTIKSNTETLSVPNFTVKQFHSLISELNRLNPNALVSVTINVGQTQIATKQNKNF
jgi:hypothetical protein